MAVGMVPSSIFDDMIEDVETEFDSEDTLLLFTDGVSEATNQDGEEYGLQNLKVFASENASYSPNVVNRKLINKLDAYTSSELERDDITLLCVKMK